MRAHGAHDEGSNTQGQEESLSDGRGMTHVTALFRDAPSRQVALRVRGSNTTVSLIAFQHGVD